MGLIKAAVSAVSGNLADQWLEVIEPDNMTNETFMTPGVQVSTKRGSNTKRNSNIISNGSVIHVYPNQMMLLIDGGRIVDYCAEEGYYTVNMSTSPSLFNGEFKESLKDAFNRFKFGGIPSQSQKVYFINLQEITGIKFGTRNPIQYFDNFYNAELFMRCRGQYSIKIVDPLKFFGEAASKTGERFTAATMNSQYCEEFLTALESAINQMSVDGKRVSYIQSQSRELAKYMSQTLDEEWREGRGIEIASVAVTISYDEQSQKLINMRNQGAMLSDATIREGYVQGSIADGLKAAGSNSAGAAQAFMGMGMGMNTAGGFMSSASQTNAMQMQMQQQQMQAAQAQAQSQQPAAGGWTCSCGKANTGKFCQECGAKKPEDTTWTCSCGKVNTGKFCQECGTKKPENSSWQCSCGQVNEGKFCSGCGTKKPE